MKEGDILTVQEVARMLRVSRSSVFKLRYDGVLQAKYKFFDGERGWRWSREDVEAFITSRTVNILVDRVPRPFVPVSICN